MNAPFIDAHHIVPQRFQYSERPLTYAVLPNTVTCFIGPKQSGKSNYMATLAGLFPPHSGSLKLLGYDADGLTQRQWESLRPQLGYLDPNTALIAGLNGLQNVLMPSLYHHRDTPDRLERKALQLIHAVDMDIPLLKMVPYLTPEQRFELKLSRALLLQPRVLFMDEAFKGLHHLSLHDCEVFLIDWIRTHHAALVICTHRIQFVEQYADHIIYLSDQMLRHFDSFTALAQCQIPEIRHYLDETKG